jgi:hypothetical protein
VSTRTPTPRSVRTSSAHERRSIEGTHPGGARRVCRQLGRLGEWTLTDGVEREERVLVAARALAIGRAVTSLSWRPRHLQRSLLPAVAKRHLPRGCFAAN